MKSRLCQCLGLTPALMGSPVRRGRVLALRGKLVIPESTRNASFMAKRFPSLILVVCLALFTGCLEFEQQTLTYRYDAKTDTLRIFQSYQGIFGADAKDGLSQDELAQLDSVLTGQRTFFFANWIFEYNRDQLRETVDKLKQSDAQQELKMEPAALGRAESLLKLLLDNVRVENGPFYLDPQGKLCGVQRVTIKQCTKITAAVNPVIRDYLKVEAAKDDTSAENRSLYLKSAERQREYIKIDGNQFRLTLPFPRQDYEKTFGPNASDTRMIEQFKRCGGKISFAKDELSLIAGEPTNTTASVTLPVSTKPYVPNALETVKKRASIELQFDAEAAAKRFVTLADEKQPKR